MVEQARGNNHMKFIVPEHLETDRLLLRPFRDDDWLGLHAYYSDEVAMKFTWGRSLSEGETWRTMCTMIGHWQLRGYGPYVVEENSSSSIIGIVGFWYPNNWPEPEIKWALSRQYWGKGFAKEAASVVLRAGREYIPEIDLISLIHRDNKPSIGVAMSIGATLESTIDFEGEPHGIYRHKTTT